MKEHRIVENGDVFDFSISDEDMQVLVSAFIILQWMVTMIDLSPADCFHLEWPG